MTHNQYRPAWWLRNPHLQTIYAARLRRINKAKLKYQQLTMPDGGIIDLAEDITASHAENHSSDHLTDRSPIALILHGLEGSAESRYVRGILAAIAKQQWRGIVMHQRGCGPTPSVNPRSYHALEIDDLNIVLQHLKNSYPAAPVYLIGYSLGGAIVLNWLTSSPQATSNQETNNQTTKNNVKAAVAVSVPMQLADAATRMSTGFSAIYQRDLIASMRSKLQYRQSKFPKELGHIDLKSIKTFYDFDNYLTAPLHGFKNAHDYYTQGSPLSRLKNIDLPTLIIHAQDDPFMLSSSTPSKAQVSDKVTLHVSSHGGHVGFIGGKYPWKPKYWLEEVIPAYLKKQMNSSA